MPDENQIQIDLRLQMDKLGQDAAKAREKIKSGLASNVKGVGETSIEQGDRVAEERRAREKRERAQRNRKLDEADEFRRQREMERQRRLFERNNPAAKVPQPGQNIGRNIRAISYGLSGVGLGVPGLGAIAALSQLNPALSAVVGEFTALRMILKEVNRAAEDARKMYAKSLMSGFGLNFTTQRSLLANAIGVGENEVYQFGSAVNYLNGKLSDAAKILSRTNPTLTTLSWNTSVLKADFEAMKSTFAAGLAPAVNTFTTALDLLVKKLTRYSSEILSLPGIQSIINVSKFVKWNWNLNAGPENGAKEPPRYIRQMRASQWEHMGLVIGGAGGTNYNKNIDRNTKRMASILETMPEKIAAAYARYNSHRDRDSLPSMP